LIEEENSFKNWLQERSCRNIRGCALQAHDFYRLNGRLTLLNLILQITNAERGAQSGNMWSELLLYIKAKEFYPFSSIANDEITNLSGKILGK